MAQVVVPWSTGTGSITLTFTGQGNGTITVSSSPNNLSVQRSQNVTVKTTDNSVQVTVAIVQAAASAVPNFNTADNKYIVTSDGKYFNVTEEE